MRRYPTNREFIKKLRHNGNTYTLRSIFDTDNQYDFDATIAKFNRDSNKFSFDRRLQQLYHEQINLHDDLEQLYDTDLLV